MQAEEEKFIKAMRREMVVVARPVPKFDKPFVPQRYVQLNSQSLYRGLRRLTRVFITISKLPAMIEPVLSKCDYSLSDEVNKTPIWLLQIHERTNKAGLTQIQRENAQNRH